MTAASGASTASGTGRGPVRASVAGGAAATAAAAVVLAPWWRPGALLVRDLVAVPDPAWSTALLGGADRLPRDVPGEVLAAAAGQVVPGDLVVRVVLVVALVALGAGAGRLLDRGPLPAAVAGLVAVWNPYVLARLHQGQWLVVVALAAVPWIVVHVAADDRWRLARTLVLAGTSGFLALVVVGPTLLAVAVATRRWRALAVGLGVLGLVSLPWLVVTAPVVADPDAVEAFAPSADLPLGVLPSLLTGGGYFNTAVASPWRGAWVVAVLALLLAGIAVTGAVAWVRSGAPTSRRARAGVLAVGLAGVLVAAATATAVGQDVLVELGEAVPASAVLRDSQRLLAPWVVVLAVGAGLAADWLGRRARQPAAAAVLLAVLTAVALPDPVVGPRLPAPVDLPVSWQRAAAAIDREPAPVLVVPHGQTQRYPFTDRQPVAVPLRRMVGAPVLVDSRLVVGTAEGELVVEDRAGGERARELADAWPDVSGADLAAAGIGWVAVTDPDLAGAPPPGTSVVVDGRQLQLLHVTDQEPAPVDRGPPRWVLVVDLLVALAAVALLVLPAVRRADTGRSTRPQDADDR